MATRSINARDILEYSLRSLLESMQDATQFAATGAGASGEAKILLARPERSEGYDPQTIIVEVADIVEEEHRNAGYVRTTLSSTGTYPAGAQKAEEVYARRIHIDLSFRILARTTRGLLALRGQLTDYLGASANDNEYSPDRFSIAVKDYAEDPAEATDIKLSWRFPSKASTWTVVQVPGEQLLNGILTLSVYVDAYHSKTYDQLWKFTEDITLL